MPLTTQVEMANKIGSNREELPVLDQRKGLNFSLLFFRLVCKYELRVCAEVCGRAGDGRWWSGRGNITGEVEYCETLN